jgi:Holliday junction resolvase RusA-like endonuclease
MQICPNVLTVKVIMKVEQVLGHYRKEAPDFDSMEKAIQDALNKKK